MLQACIALGAVDLSGFWLDGLIIGGPVVVVLGSALWATLDAAKRGQGSDYLVGLAVLISWPIALMLWLLLRPPLKRGN